MAKRTTDEQARATVNSEHKLNVLVLNGSDTEKSTVDAVSDYLVDFLRIEDHEVEVMVLREENIASCLGCFSCWLRTPGRCIINDAGRDLPKKIIQSDLVVLLSPVVFGMYSPELKKAIDRYACPILLPFFTKVNGETHHKLRYKKYPTLLGIGVLPNKDEESESTFKALVAKNGVNMHTSGLSTIVYSTDDSRVLKEKVMAVLAKVGA